MFDFSIVVAMDAKNGIGKNGQLPWHLPADLKHFKGITTETTDAHKRNVVIMGRVTWDSLPVKVRPLPGRINAVISRNKGLELPENVILAENIEVVHQQLVDRPLDYENVYVIGGQQIYENALKMFHCKRLYITHLKQSFDCDTYFPPYLDNFEQLSASDIASENNIDYSFCVYEQKK